MLEREWSSKGISGTCRGIVLKYKVYVLLHASCLEMGVIPNQPELASKIGIDVSSITKAIEVFTYPKTYYRLPALVIKTEDYIRQFATKLCISDYIIEDMIKESQRIFSDKRLANYQHMVLVSSFFNYYFKTHGMVMNENKLFDNFGLSKNVVSSCYNLIVDINNNQN